MKKIFFLLLIFLFSANFACAEKLPEKWLYEPLNPQEYPVIHQYFTDYTNQLFNAFDALKFGRKEWGTAYEFILHKDGNISDLKIDKFIKEDNEFDDYVKEVIVNNPLPPFPAAIEEEQIAIRTAFFKTPWNDVYYKYSATRRKIKITIDKKYKRFL